MLSTIFQSAFVLSISALAAAAPTTTQADSARVFNQVNFQGWERGVSTGGCTNLEEVELFHKLGSMTLLPGQNCKLFFDPNCEKTPVCILQDQTSYPDLFTLEGNPCPNSGAFGVGHGVESVFCSAV
ncbi:hypothetical protein FQN54_005904 [Arachnomyces sp. PD_36]|nr:hypothetical protein FQN54_005904 [Arachnomyces sp. PD_36]